MKNIFEAIADGSLGTIKALVLADPKIVNSAIGEYGESPLMDAISDIERSYEIINFLVEMSADVNFRTKEGYTALHSNANVTGTSGTGELPARIARLLKTHGADVEARNHYGWTPLMRAALEGVPDEFKALLDIGAKYDVRYTEHSMPVFTRGRSLPHILLPSPDKMSVLLEYGFRPEASLLDEGRESLAEANDPDSAFAKDVRVSMDMIERALRAS